jgi:hypothetical protein
LVSVCHGRGGYFPNPVVTRQTFPGVGGGVPLAGQTPAPLSKAIGGGAGGGIGATPAAQYPAATARPAATQRANPWAGFNWAAWFGGRGY